MTLATYYIELAVAIAGFLLVLIGVLLSVDIMIKTAKKLKRVVIYFLISIIPFSFYLAGRILNLETAFAWGKILSLAFSLFSLIFILMGLCELNKIVNELIGPKREFKSENKIKINNTKQEEKKFTEVLNQNIDNKYLDLTGRKPKFRQ
jgi:hypothetical protein